jgi:hypothetical protein
MAPAVQEEAAVEQTVLSDLQAREHLKVVGLAYAFAQDLPTAAAPDAGPCSGELAYTAQRVLLNQLRDAGARLCYHGDTDWPG